MSKKKWRVKILCIVSVLCWIATIIPGGYVLYRAYDSMNGTMHGFNGEMLYGIEAFIDTILVYCIFVSALFALGSMLAWSGYFNGSDFLFKKIKM